MEAAYPGAGRILESELGSLCSASSSIVSSSMVDLDELKAILLVILGFS